MGEISLVHASNDAGRLYFQQAAGSNAGTIAEYSLTGPFDTGHIFATGPVPQVIVPADEVAEGSPITATILTSNSTPFQEVHVFFLSPSNILSEYYWLPIVGWSGGSSCGSACVTSLNAHVDTSSDIIITANQDINNDFLLVTFVDANNTGTLTQAIKRNGVWNTTLSTLHGLQG
ncbi:hypothetical protein H0H92_006429 [Tricholoma furcatifolium]|nr:hypothetical protein H0H92_006429 [Tricholoma furcatifolium]